MNFLSLCPTRILLLLLLWRVKIFMQTRIVLVPSFLSFRLRGPWLLLSIYRHRHLDNEVYVSTLFFSSRDDKLDGEGRKKGDGRVATLLPRLDGPRYR